LRVQSGQYVPPEQANPNLSTSLSYVIRRAMSLDPDQRYQSADELLVDLEAILRTEFGSAGQTALKLWLAALGRRDGEVPISRSVAFAAKGGAEGLEGKFVELGDDEETSQDLRMEALGAHGHHRRVTNATQPPIPGAGSAPPPWGPPSGARRSTRPACASPPPSARGSPSSARRCRPRPRASPRPNSVRRHRPSRLPPPPAVRPSPRRPATSPSPRERPGRG